MKIKCSISDCKTMIERYPSQIKRSLPYCPIHKGGKIPLTDTANKVFDCIVRYKADNGGNSPSWSDISKELGLAHWAISLALNELKRQGKIKITGGKIHVFGGQWKLKETKNE